MSTRVIVRARRAVVQVRLGRIPVGPAASGGSPPVAISRSTAGVTTATTALDADAVVLSVVVTGDEGTVLRLGWSNNDEALISEQALPATGFRWQADDAPTGTRRLVLTTIGDGLVRALITHGIPES